MDGLGFKKRLLIAFVLAGVTPLLAFSLFNYFSVSGELTNSNFATLKIVRDIKKKNIEEFFKTVEHQVVTFAHNASTIESTTIFTQGFSNFEVPPEGVEQHRKAVTRYYENDFSNKYKETTGQSPEIGNILSKLSPLEITFQNLYIASNSNPLGSKDGLEAVHDGSAYDDQHLKFHRATRNFVNNFGYYDVFLVSAETGHIVYSVFKELDFATSLKSGPYASSAIGIAYKQAMAISDEKSMVLTDYRRYLPSFEAPAMFAAAPIWDKGEKIGAAIFQVPYDRLNSAMKFEGLGKTNEGYIVGSDGLLRTDTTVNQEEFTVAKSFANPDQMTIHTDAAKLAMSGKTGQIQAKNYVGDDVISSYTPIEIHGHQWALVVDEQIDEALGAASSMQKQSLIGITLTFLLLVFMGFLISGSLASRMVAVASQLFSGAKSVAHSSEEMRTNSQSLSASSADQAASLQQTVSSIDEISSMIQRNADSASVAKTAAGNAEASANQGKATVQEMISAISEISDSNREIMQEMVSSNDEISKIVELIKTIGEKTKVINDIVFQTKLLSFNASVEAARAGEHGKGFAVVAEEVGNLATMSGKAALEITGMLDSSTKQVSDTVSTNRTKVERLVSAGKEKVDHGAKKAAECGVALDEILKSAGEVNSMVEEIAAASSEQSLGVQEVTKAMQNVDKITHSNATFARQAAETASSLQNQAHRLSSAVSELLEYLGSDGTSNPAPKTASMSHLSGASNTPKAPKKSAKPAQAQPELVIKDLVLPGMSPEPAPPPAPAKKEPAAVAKKSEPAELPSAEDDRFVDF